MKFQVKINSANNTSETMSLTGKHTVYVKQNDVISFELLDLNTNLAPQSIVAKRVGNNLEITIENSPITNLVIEDYYTNDEAAPIIGLAEDGKYYAYIPESGVASDSIPALGDNILATEVLGGNEVAIAPLFLGIPGTAGWYWLAGGVAAAGLAALLMRSKHNESTPKDTIPLSDEDHAKVALDEAKAADAALKQALQDALADGVITPEEKAKLNSLKTDADNKKAAAEEAVNKLPEGNKYKDGLNDVIKTLDGIPPVDKPNDTDNDGMTDADERAAEADVEPKVVAAEEAERNAEAYLRQANGDGRITQDEHNELVRLNQEVTNKKAEADAAVKALDDKVDGKQNFQNRVNDVDPVEVPPVSRSTTTTNLQHINAGNSSNVPVNQSTDDLVIVGVENGSGKIYGQAGKPVNINLGAGNDEIRAIGNDNAILSQNTLIASRRGRVDIDMGEGDDKITAKSIGGEETLIKMGSGNDTLVLTGKHENKYSMMGNSAIGTAGDGVFLGEGNDKIEAVSGPSPSFRVDGGSGYDIYKVTGARERFDVDAGGDVTGFERVDLTGSGNNYMSFSNRSALETFLQNNHDTSSINVGGRNYSKVFIVDGNAGDTFTVNRYTPSQTGTVEYQGQTYKTYNIQGVNLWIDDDIIVNGAASNPLGFI